MIALALAFLIGWCIGAFAADWWKRKRAQSEEEKS